MRRRVGEERLGQAAPDGTGNVAHGDPGHRERAGPGGAEAATPFEQTPDDLAADGAGGPETSSAVLADIVAVARGAGSTWAGLAPATNGSDGHATAGDGLAGARHWYAFIPALDLARTDLPAALDEAAAIDFETGTAIRTEHVTLDEARAAFAAVLPPDADATLYPCDD